MNPSEFLDPDFLQKLDQLSILSRKVFRGLLKGERRSKKKGVSIEFADYRDYVPGDDLRFLDWNIYGRLEKLFIKLFQEEEDLNIFLLVDASPSMNFGTPTKFNYAKKIAAALGYIALNNLDRASIASFSDDIYDHFPLCRGKSSVWRLFDFLSQSKICESGTTNLYDSCRSFVQRAKGSGIVVVISDFMDPSGYEQSLPFFMSPHRDVFVIQILSSEEISPDLKGDLRLIDSETDMAVDLSITAEILAKYNRALHGYLHNFQNWCVQHNIVYMFTSTQQPFDDLVLKYLRNVGILR